MQKSVKMFSNLVSITLLLLTFSISAQNKYVGVKSCGMCHKKAKVGEQLKIWEESKHASAFRTLQTEEADKIAAEKGFKTKAAATPECLKCHVTGYDKDAKMFGKKFNIEDGVQCESCHGAGSKFKKKKIMKDHAKAVDNGLVKYKDEISIKDLCRTCHNEESPTFKKFDFKKRWEKIKHPIPKKS